jgi:hypothetical protein
MAVAVHRRRYPQAGLIVVATSAVVVAQAAAVQPWPAGTSILDRAVRLVAGDSILNVPFNLFQDLFNIPANEVAATNVLADSFFSTGTWWWPSATNLWGEDPGDPGHFMAIFDFLFPFAPQVSGLDQPEIDPALLANGTAGLGQQFAMLAAAELPVSASCDAVQCAPLVPTDPITGLTALDRLIDFEKVFTNFPNADNQLGLFSHWLKVPLQQLLTGYQFPSTPADTANPTAAGIADPSAGVGPGGSVPGAPLDAVPGSEAQPGFGFPGTTTGPDGANLMPWAGTDVQLNPLGPFEQWFQSLEAPVNLNGFQLVGPDDVGQALKALAAGMVVDFNPFTPGSPLCPELCDQPPFAPPFGLTTADLVQSIQNVGPPNPLISEWLSLNSSGLANAPTPEQIDATVAGLQTGWFTLNPDTENQIVDYLDDINPNLAKLLVNSGLMTDPAYLGPWAGTGGPDSGVDVPAVPSELGGLDQTQIWPDLLGVVDPTGSLSNDLSDFWASLSSIWDGFGL